MRLANDLKGWSSSPFICSIFFCRVLLLRYDAYAECSELAAQIVRGIAFVFVYSVVYTSLQGFGQYEICFLHIVISGIRMLSSHSPARSLNEYDVCRHLASAEAGSTLDITTPQLSCFCADRTSAAVSCQYSASLIRVGMTRSSRTCWQHEGRRLADLLPCGAVT